MKKIVILDDSEIIRGIVAVVLGAQGYAVVGIDAPTDLATTVERDDPDLVLLDLTLPKMQSDGLVALARASSAKKCPIILFSDRPDAELAIRTAASGATRYLRKGDPTVLARHVKRLLG